MFAAEKIYLNNSDWGGFPAFAIPVVYTVPAFIQIVVSFAVGNYKKDRLSVSRTLAAILISLPILTSLTFFFKVCVQQSYSFNRLFIFVYNIIIVEDNS